MDEQQKTELKKQISTILLSAINGLDKQYRTKNGYIQWGLVEKHIHMLIDDIKGDESS
jgi:hypothetical protein